MGLGERVRWMVPELWRWTGEATGFASGHNMGPEESGWGCAPGCRMVRVSAETGARGGAGLSTGRRKAGSGHIVRRSPQAPGSKERCQEDSRVQGWESPLVHH